MEIELKAWVDDPEDLRARLRSFAGSETAFEKADTYWLFSGAGRSIPLSGIRIRRETSVDPAGMVSRALWVTYKIKEIREGIEINDEREFSVSDSAAFEELLRRLGLEKGMEKRKKGWAWIYEGVTTELTEVEGLGWFVELEIISGDDKNETISAVRSRLLTLLHKIGVKRDRIEPRYYTEMLGEKAQGSPSPCLD